jgi:hypothetical protein
VPCHPHILVTLYLPAGTLGDLNSGGQPGIKRAHDSLASMTQTDDNRQPER